MKAITEIPRLNATIHLQKVIPETTFKEWIGNLEQADDVTIIGVRV